MRRRRKKNPLLTRIIVVSIAAHVIALPIAAHYGAFEKVRRQFGSSNLVVINTPPIDEKKIEKTKKQPPKPQRTEPKRNNAAAKRSGSAAKPNPNAPKVIAATGNAGEANGPSVDPNGTGKAGALPTNSNPQPNGGPGTGNTKITPAPEIQKPVAPPLASTPQPSIEPLPTPIRKVRKFVQVETTYAPEPVIPDDLRSEPFEKTATIYADVSAAGSSEHVRISQSSGDKELDDIGLDTAKRYRFRAATLDDVPVEGHVRFRIIFKVE